MSLSGGAFLPTAAQQCYESWVEWRAASETWKTLSAPRTTTTITDRTTYISPAGTGTPYSLTCDGITRMAMFSTTGTTTSVDSRSRTLTLRDMRADFELPKPNCSIGPGDCNLLRDKWYETAYGNSSIRLEQNGTPFIWDPKFPVCDAGKCDCVVRGRAIALIYWPSTTPMPENHCVASGITPPNTTPTPSVPQLITTNVISIKATETITDHEKKMVKHLVNTKGSFHMLQVQTS